MPTMQTTPTDKGTWRHSVMFLGAVILAFFSFLIISANVFFGLRDRGASEMRGAIAHSNSVAQLVQQQVADNGNLYALRGSVRGGLTTDSPIALAELLPRAEFNSFANDTSRFEPLGVDAVDVETLLQRLATAPTEIAIVGRPGHILTARTIEGQHAFVLIYDRAALSTEIFRAPIGRWITGLVILALCCLTLLWILRHLIQRPIERLSRAIGAAEQTLDLNITPPLPNNEIGQLAVTIDAWLDRLRVAQSDLSRMALIVDRTENAVMILTRALKIEWTNSAFEKLSGFKSEEMRDRTLGNLMVQGDVNKDASLRFRKAVRAGEGCVEEILIACKDGSTRWIMAELQPVLDDNGKVTGWTGINTDITEQKATEQELASRIADLEQLRAEQAELTEQLKLAKLEAERGSRSKSDFLANMSHEIRTPMNGVLGMAEVLMAGDLSEEQTSYVETIQESGKALLSIINDILDLSKLEAGKVELSENPMDVRDVAAAVTRLMTPRAEAKCLALTCSTSASVAPQYLGDEGRLRQVVTNLVGNAIKFTKHGEVQLRVLVNTDDVLRFEVQDTGRGISEDLRKRLFQRFEQGKARKDDGAGSGLGLSISEQLVTLMGGTIGVESEIDKGSTFWFEVPLKPAVEFMRGSDMDSEIATQEKPKALRILLAEDHPVNQSLMKAFVAKLGHALTIADDGVDAVKAVRSEDFDLILMDIQMPRMDGVMATKVIRSLETKAAHVPIIAVTAHAMAGQREHYLSAGMNGYVSKPVQLSTLQEEINRVMDAATADDSAAGDDADDGEDDARQVS